MPDAQDAAAVRSEAWTRALGSGRLPDFVEARLAEARGGRAPWLATMSPADLLAARRHGIRPVATVSGTCWYHYGFSWTNGHAEGWHKALARMRAEAVAAGANAVVDVKLRTLQGVEAGPSMDYMVIGTAVRVDGLPASRDPVLATVTTMEFMRLLEAGIVPVGVAIGACYDWLRARPFSSLSGGVGNAVQTMPLPELSDFCGRVRDRAIAALRADTKRLGNGVLAHTQFGQVFRKESSQDNQPRFLARYIVLGTAIQCERGRDMPHDISPVVDMRDDASPLRDPAPRGHSAYTLESEQDGAI